MVVGGGGGREEGKLSVGAGGRDRVRGGRGVGTPTTTSGMKRHVHRSVPAGATSKLEGVAGREADVGAGVHGGQRRGD